MYNIEVNFLHKLFIYNCKEILKNLHKTQLQRYNINAVFIQVPIGIHFIYFNYYLKLIFLSLLVMHKNFKFIVTILLH